MCTFMKVGILHLSDIHFVNDQDWIFGKAKKIGQAVLSSWEDLDTLFIVVSGDIANSGQLDEYLVADQFFNEIKTYVVQQSGMRVVFIMAPGNHDCDLSGSKGDSKARKSFIDSVLQKPGNVTVGDTLYEGCLAVQDDFFDFARSLEPTLGYPVKPEAFYQIEIESENHCVSFNVFNTAWLSQMKEEQGSLVFPTHLASIDGEHLAKCSISLSLFHHPDNWLNASQAMEFRKMTEQNSDIVLSGHEHNRELFIKRDTETEAETQIIRATALQERDRPELSGFNVIVLDLAVKKQKYFEYKWKHVEYERLSESDWNPFLRNRFLQKLSFFHLPDFEVYLNALDSVSQHRGKHNVVIDDFFIPPKLFMTSLKGILDGKDAIKRIESEEFWKFLFEQKKLLIYGETWQGKTTVAKMVVKMLYDRQFVPVLIDGSKFSAANAGAFKKTLRASFEIQFNPSLWQSFEQLPKEKRALVIDNFGQSGLNQESLQFLLEAASSCCDHVIVFAHNNLRMQQHLQNETGEIKLSEYGHCRMLYLDASQRTHLIRKWIRLDAAPKYDEAEPLSK